MTEGTKGYMAVTSEDKSKYFQEEFKGEVINNDVKFPKELGIEHPFEFEDIETLLKKTGIVSGLCNKITDSILGDFSIKAKEPKVRVAIQEFIKESNLIVVLREWILEAIAKGNGFLEIDLKDKKINVLNANHMYVVRDKKGVVKGYNQFLGKSMKTFSLTSRNVTSFYPNEVAHLKINKIPGDAYGMGYLMPNERVIENIILDEEDVHKLISRKAGAPYHVKVGQPGEVTDPAAVDAIKNLLVYMTNRTEWVTDANVDIKAIQMGEIGKNLMDVIMHDVRMLCAGMQVPEVMLNSGQLNEGIAKVQLESFQRTIASIQEDIETTIESKIFKPILLSQGLQGEVEFTWNLPGEEEINLRLTQLNSILSNTFLTDGMRKEIQMEMAKLLNFANPESLVSTPNTQGQTADKNPVFTPDGKQFQPDTKSDKASSEIEKKQEAELKQPELPREKPNADSKAVNKLEEAPVINDVPKIEQVIDKCECGKKHITEEQASEMTIKEYINLIESGGFNYSDYLINILKRLRVEKFEDLKAITEKDIESGLLDPEQVEKLRLILKDGFRKNKSMQQITSDIKNDMRLTDRIAENGAVISANTRPELIARTETVRLANLGLVDTYKKNKIEKVRYLAALSDRTCPICEGLNGQVFEIAELQTGVNMAPMHVNCRCSLLSITE
jgi:SPP1 gp7 family putative phage head morphogenesis protein